MKSIEIPDARITVHRADGSIEHDAQTDSYAILVAQTVGMVRSLRRLDAGRLHTRDVLATIATIRDKTAGGAEITAEVTVPQNAELAGVMLMATVLAVKKTNPAAFAVFLRRLEDAGQSLTPVST